jgi:hypothetical protein
MNSIAIQRRYANSVWSFYTIDEETLTQTCNTCGQKLNAPPNTTNSKKHLKAKHPELFEILLEMDKHCQKPNIIGRKRKRTEETASSSPDCETQSLDNEIAHQIVKSFLENAFINGSDFNSNYLYQLLFGHINLVF